LGWNANAVEILAARPRPRLCEIRTLSSISRFDNESQKKLASLSILVLDSRRFTHSLGTGSPDGLRYFFVWIDVGINKRCGWFLNF
jgi:hypothetical protein